LLREGYTTGACAAAAAKAATLMLFSQQPVEMVEISLPAGKELKVAILEIQIEESKVSCAVEKDGGDDPDSTHGLKIFAQVSKLDSFQGERIILCGGEGVGVVTKPGLQVSVGEAAINPVPRMMICQEIEKVLPSKDVGVEVTISVPGGEEIAKRTFNPRLGIMGGISILGTTGIVKPMSEEAFKASLALQLQIAVAKGIKEIVLTPGNIGEKIAKEKLDLYPEAIVQMSNFVGFMLEECRKSGIEKILLLGHHGKLVKIAGGIFQTHSRVADAKKEIIASYAVLVGADRETVARILAANTAEEVLGIIEEQGLEEVFKLLAEKVSQKASQCVYEEIEIGCILVSLAGKILGMDQKGQEWMRRKGK